MRLALFHGWIGRGTSAHRDSTVYQKPVIVLVGFLVAGGCENPWQTGTWVEEGFASTDDSCQASIVTEPAEPYRYTMGEMTDWDDWPESNDLTSTQEWIQSRSDNFWKYCQTSGSAVLFGRGRLERPRPLHEELLPRQQALRPRLERRQLLHAAPKNN